MSRIHLTTFIAAPVQRVYDLSRSINLHKISTAHTQEQAINGVMTGLIKEGETVTWQAKYLFKQRKFTTKITAMKMPESFTDEMIEGDFKSFYHQHYFKPANNGTIMIDVLNFESPYSLAGKFFNSIYLKQYIQHLLQKRNEVIKDYAETMKWKAILN